MCLVPLRETALEETLGSRGWTGLERANIEGLAWRRKVRLKLYIPCIVGQWKHLMKGVSCSSEEDIAIHEDEVVACLHSSRHARNYHK